MLRQIRWAHRAARFLVEAVGSTHLTTATEALGAHEARVTSLFGLVGAARASRALLVAIAVRTGEFTGGANLTNLVASAFIL